MVRVRCAAEESRRFENLVDSKFETGKQQSTHDGDNQTERRAQQAGNAHAPARSTARREVCTRQCTADAKKSEHEASKNQALHKPNGWAQQGRTHPIITHNCYLGRSSCALLALCGARPHLWLVDWQVRATRCCGVERISRVDVWCVWWWEGTEQVGVAEQQFANLHELPFWGLFFAPSAPPPLFHEIDPPHFVSVAPFRHRRGHAQQEDFIF